MKINSFKKQKHWYLIHTWSQRYRCKSGNTIFAWRVDVITRTVPLKCFWTECYFRKVREKRDYHKGRKSMSWLYLSRISATKVKVSRGRNKFKGTVAVISWKYFLEFVYMTIQFAYMKILSGVCVHKFILVSVHQNT